MNGLEVERAWLTGCSRCANEGTSYAETEAEAITELADWGWSREGYRQFCPACNGEIKS